MSVYQPESWIILKVNSEKHGIFYKVLASVMGNWRLNSGITKVVEKPEAYLVYGHSGSVYECFKDSERVQGHMVALYESLIKDPAVEEIKMKDLPEEFFEQSELIN